MGPIFHARGSGELMTRQSRSCAPLSAAAHRYPVLLQCMPAAGLSRAAKRNNDDHESCKSNPCNYFLPAVSSWFNCGGKGSVGDSAALFCGLPATYQIAAVSVPWWQKFAILGYFLPACYGVRARISSGVTEG